MAIHNLATGREPVFEEMKHRCGLAHAMLREIYEQPEALQRTEKLYLTEDSLRPQVAALLKQWPVPEGEVLIVA